MIRIVCLLFLAGSTWGQSDVKQRVDGDLTLLKSGQPSQRESAFYDLTEIGCPQCENSRFPVVDGLQNAISFGAVSKGKLISELNELLSTEAIYHSRQTEESEDYVTYLGDVVQALSWLRDKSSADALFAFIDTGNMAEDALASFGETSLVKVQALLDSTEPAGLKRSSAIRVLSKMAQEKNLRMFADRAAARVAIKRALIRGLEEKDSFNRSEAVSGLAGLGDTDVIPLLERIAASDAYADVHPNTIGVRYPVRNEASKALIQLRAKASAQ